MPVYWGYWDTAKHFLSHMQTDEGLAGIAVKKRLKPAMRVCAQARLCHSYRRITKFSISITRSSCSRNAASPGQTQPNRTLSSVSLRRSGSFQSSNGQECGWWMMRQHVTGLFLPYSLCRLLIRNTYAYISRIQEMLIWKLR